MAPIRNKFGLRRIIDLRPPAADCCVAASWRTTTQASPAAQVRGGPRTVGRQRSSDASPRRLVYYTHARGYMISDIRAIVLSSLAIPGVSHGRVAPMRGGPCPSRTRLAALNLARPNAS